MKFLVRAIKTMSRRPARKNDDKCKSENTLNVMCFVSSVREGRVGDRMIKLIENEFEDVLKPREHVLEIIDPLQHELPLLKQPLHFYGDQSKAPASLRNLNSKVAAADAYIILTAEYNRMLPPALTNLMNHLPPSSFDYKPSGIVSYSMGPQGGVVAATMARPFLAELGCLPVKHSTNIANAHREIDEDGNTENHRIQSSLKKLFTQLEWWGRASKKLRDTEGIPKVE